MVSEISQGSREVRGEEAAVQERVIVGKGGKVEVQAVVRSVYLTYDFVHPATAEAGLNARGEGQERGLYQGANHFQILDAHLVGVPVGALLFSGVEVDAALHAEQDHVLRPDATEATVELRRRPDKNGEDATGGDVLYHTARIALRV